MRFVLLLYFLVDLSVIAWATGPKPNVLLIVCDDLNTHVSTSGYKEIETPTFDLLASDAMTFARAYCQYPVCGPSRASFLSGLYPESTGVLDNSADIRITRPNTVSLPQHFKDNGYWTASVGKVFHNPRLEPGEIAWHEQLRFENDELPTAIKARERFEANHGSVDRPKNRRKWRAARKQAIAALNAQTPPGHGRSGLQDHQHKDGKNARQVVDWLSSKSFGDKPFFIALGIQKPHVPFLAPDKYFDLYPQEEIDFFQDRTDLWDSLPQDALSKRFKAFGFQLGVENVELRREYMQAYHACITFLDAQLALVIKQLKNQGLYDNTIIVLTSDHGYHLGDHFLWGKVTLFDIGTRVPMIIRVPGTTKPGSRNESMVELIDIYPTLLQLAGLTTPHQLQGTSLLPLLQSPTHAGSKTFAYSVVQRRGGLGRAIRNQRWRYSQWPEGEELYDLQLDPKERHNLAADPSYEDQLVELRAVLAERQAMARSQKMDLSEVSRRDL